MVSIYSWGNENSYEFLRASGTAPITAGQAPAMGGVQSGIPVLAWSTTQGAYFQFLDLLGNPDPDPLFSRVELTKAPGVANIQVADALVAYGALWMEGNQIKLTGVAQEQGLVGQEVIVGTGRSASLSAYSFDTGVTDPDNPTKTIFANGVTVAWVDLTGTIRLQRYQIVNDATGHPSALVPAGIDGQVDATAVHAPGDVVPASDAAITLGTGRDAKVQNLHNGDTLITWVGTDNQVHARLYPPNGVVVGTDTTLNGLTQADYTAVNQQLATLGAIPANATVQVAELGPGNFAVVWQTAAGLEVRIFALPPDGIAGDGLPNGWTLYNASIAAADMPGFTGEFALTGLGEDNSNLVISYTGSDATGTGVFARVVDVSAIDGTPNSISVGPAAQVNTITAGDQKLVGITGLFSDRFMVSYVDVATGTVQSRILDTRAPNQLLVGDDVRDRDADGTLNAGDRVRSRPDVIVGTNGDDVVIADRLDPQIAGVRFDDPLGSDDEIYGGMGSDIMFGGGGFDIIDGGIDLATDGRADPDPQFAGVTAKAFTDTAIYQGSFINYNVFINGDGSYSILDARFDDGANIVDTLADGTQNLDGWDVVANVETLQFLNGNVESVRSATYAANLADAKAALASPANATNIDTSLFYKINDQDHRLTGNVALPSLTTGDVDPAGEETVLTPVGWDLADPTKAANGFAVANTAAAEGRPQIAATIDSFMTSWEVAGTGGAATLRMQVYDALGEPILVDGTTSPVITVTTAARAGTAAIAGTGVGTAAVWINNATGAVQMQAYDLGNLPLGPVVTVQAAAGITDVALGSISIEAGLLANMPAEQVTVAWVQNGAIFAQRYGFPVDAAGVEQPPVALGRDGVTTGVNTPFQIAASGTLPSVAGLHDGEIAITYVTNTATGPLINVRAIRPDGTEVTSATDATVLQDIQAQGTITTPPTLVGAGEGDIVVGWTQSQAGIVTTKLAIYRITEGWGSPEVMTLQVPPTAQDVSFAIAGEGPMAVVVTWREADGDVVGQRFEFASTTEPLTGNVVGIPVGDVFNVASGVTSGATGAVGFLDGRLATVAGVTNTATGADITAHIFDTRDSTDPVIGRNAGGPRDFEVGTIFDDIIDGRDREDTIYGAMGNDVLIGGINDDTLYGGGDNDDLFGGTGNDILAGEDGNDLLTGGYGRDYISGGAGIDTLSYRGEGRAVTVDLAAGTVRSDAAVNGVGLPDAATTIAFFDANGNQIANPSPEQQATIAAIFNDRGLEDVLGQIIERNHDLEIFEFDPNHGIENIEGGFGDDTLLGDAGTNFITGNGGNDVIDGRGGVDAAVFSGNFADYDIIINGTSMTVIDKRGIDTTAAGDQLTNIEVLKFKDQLYSPFDVAPVVAGPVTLAASPEDTVRTITAAELLVGASDANGDALSIRNVRVDRGTIAANANGTWTYTPVANDDTAAVFSYEVTDGVLWVNQTATLDLTPVNDLSVTAPAVLNASNEDTVRVVTSAELLRNVVDPDGPSLSVTGVTVNRGTVVSNGDGTWTFTPAANDDTNVTFSYQVTDGIATVPHSATMDLLPVNDLIVSAPAVLTAVNEDTPRTITAAELLQGVTDPEGGPITIANVTVNRGTVVANANGTWTYTPLANDDTQAVFSYTVTDGIDTVAQTATLDILPVNDLSVTAPVVLTAVNEDTVRTITSAELLQNVVDPDGPSLSVVGVTVNRGTIANNGNGTWTYTPAANDDTSVTFTYQVTDGIATVPHSATMDLLPINDLIVTAPAVLTASNEDTARIITAAELRQGVVDPEGNALTITNVTVDRGTVVANANGTWTFTPLANDDTQVVFTYRVSDGIDTVTQTARMDLLPVNDATTGAVTFGFTEAANGLSGVFTAQNTIVDGDGLRSVTYQWQASANNGTTWTNVAGATTAAYTPAAAQAGQLLRVVATATDVNGAVTSFTSALTARIGTAAAQTLTGTAGDNILAGLGGNDTLNGAAGNDTIYGGAGNDVLNGSDGVDTLGGGLGDDTINGDGGNDWIFGEDGIDTLNGNDGDDVIFGGNGNDTINGDGGPKGAGGADYLVGEAGSDVINGNDGNDIIAATIGDGNDSYTGGNGIDTFDFSNLTDNTVVNLGGGVIVSGISYAGNTASGVQNGTDSLNTIENVVGGSGNDTIITANGVNVVKGGAGSDLFIFTSTAAAGNGVGARDIIRDFTVGADRINVAAIDATLGIGGDQAFSFIGQRTGALQGGQLGYRYEFVGGVEKTIVEGNVATAVNDTTVDFQIELDGHIVLTQASFVL